MSHKDRCEGYGVRKVVMDMLVGYLSSSMIRGQRIIKSLVLRTLWVG